MGYALMIELKEPFVCEIPCEHKDCIYLKDFVSNAKCVTCENPIKSNQTYYEPRGNTKVLVHASCINLFYEQNSEKR